MNRSLLAYFSTSSLERYLTVGFSAVWHLGRNLLARYLACGVSYGLLVEALGLLFLLALCHPAPLFRRPIPRFHEWSDQVYGDRQDDRGVLVYCNLPHRLKQTKLQSSR